MPPQIGAFISEAVYNGTLQSDHKHPIKDKTQAVYFINAIGHEKVNHKSYEVSYRNY